MQNTHKFIKVIKPLRFKETEGTRQTNDWTQSPSNSSIVMLAGWVGELHKLN